MIANVEVRLDGYNFNTEIPYDRFNPFYPALGANLLVTQGLRKRVMFAFRHALVYHFQLVRIPHSDCSMDIFIQCRHLKRH